MSKLNGSILLICLVVATLPNSRAIAQYMYMDANGDGVATLEDQAKTSGNTRVDIWLQSDTNKNGDPVQGSDGPLSVFSYSFAIQVTGGTVAWKSYTNAQRSMVYSFGQASSPTEFFTGFGGTEVLPPGRYKLGTLEYGVISGSPKLEFIPIGTLVPDEITCFGSGSAGGNDDHSLRLRDASVAESVPGGYAGDWGDTDGIGTVAGKLASANRRAALPTFQVRILQEESAPRFAVTTTREGFLRVGLYDVAGRLVRHLFSSDAVRPGEVTISVPRLAQGMRRLAHGIYFYRVEATEGTKVGKIVMAR